MKQKILVLGGNGFIGRNVVMYALSLGWDVTSLSLSGSGSNQVARIAADIADISNLTATLPHPHCHYVFNGGG
jgi:nucleoside-diphosphate-sugar epimerase